MVTQEMCDTKYKHLKKEIDFVREDSIKRDLDRKKEIKDIADRMKDFITWDRFKLVTAASFSFTATCFGGLFWLIIYISTGQSETIKETSKILDEVKDVQIALNEAVKYIKEDLTKNSR